MILKRVLENNVIKAIYDSSNILASTYNKETRDLVITFKRGVQYKYYDVSLSDYTRFEMAESQGEVMNTHIKKYEFKKGDVVDQDLIVEEINKLKEEEINKKQEYIISEMGRVVDDYDVNKVFDEKKLMNIVNIINDHFNKN